MSGETDPLNAEDVIFVVGQADKDDEKDTEERGEMGDKKDAKHPVERLGTMFAEHKQKKQRVSLSLQAAFTNEMQVLHSIAGKPDVEEEVTGCGLSWRRPLAEVLHHHLFEKFMLALLAFDIVIVFTELLLLEEMFREEEREVDTCITKENKLVDEVTAILVEAPVRRRLLNVGLRKLMQVVNDTVVDVVAGSSGGNESDFPSEVHATNESSRLEHFDHLLHMCGLAVIGFFCLEICLQIVAFGKSFLLIKELPHPGTKQSSGNSKIRWMNIFDLIIVPISLMLEILVPAVGSFVALLRMWRIVRVGHGMMLAQSKRNDEERAKTEEKINEEEEHLKKSIASIMHDLHDRSAAYESRIQRLEQSLAEAKKKD